MLKPIKKIELTVSIISQSEILLTTNTGIKLQISGCVTIDPEKEFQNRAQTGLLIETVNGVGRSAKIKTSQTGGRTCNLGKKEWNPLLVEIKP